MSPLNQLPLYKLNNSQLL